MNEAVRDAFITGLQFNVICQRLLEQSLLPEYFVLSGLGLR